VTHRATDEMQSEKKALSLSLFFFLLLVRLLGQGKNSSSIVYTHTYIYRDSARTNPNLLTTISLARSLVLLCSLFLSLCRRRARRYTIIYNIDNSDHDIDDLCMNVYCSYSLINLIRSTSKYIVNISSFIE
jgi:hypothetical protein